jgi:protein phosphatase
VANLQGLGVREEQQDFFAISDLESSQNEPDRLTLLLADGMGGGQSGGDIARLVIDELRAWLAQSGPEAPFAKVIDGIVRIHSMVAQQWLGEGGTTLVAARALAGRLEFAAAGDSELFLIRAGRAYEVNQRHELIFERYAQVIRDQTTLAQAHADPQSGALTSFIGGPDLRIDYSRRPLELKAGDCLIACSDGVSDVLPWSDLAQLAALEPAAACAEIERAITLHGRADQDNYTAIVALYNPAPAVSIPSTLETRT